MANNKTVTADKNRLSQSKFQLVIDKCPNTSFFCQKVNLPGLSGQTPKVPTPFKEIHETTDHLTYNDLVVTFEIDENLSNWLEIHKWMVGLGYPESSQSFADLVNDQSTTYRPKTGSKYSDGTLLLLTNSLNANFEVKFKDLHPTSLSDIDFETTDSDDLNLQATVQFKYLIYHVERTA